MVIREDSGQVSLAMIACKVDGHRHMLLGASQWSGLQNTSTLDGGHGKMGSPGKTRKRNAYQGYRSPGRLDRTPICAKNHDGQSKNCMFYYAKLRRENM